MNCDATSTIHPGTSFTRGVLLRVSVALLFVSASYGGNIDKPKGPQTPATRVINKTGKLTLKDALSMAERYHPQVRAALASVEGAQAEVTTARMWANPTVTFGSLGRQQALLQAGVPGFLHGMNFTQPIELPMVRSTRIRAAQSRVSSSEWALEETLLQLRGVVKQAFYEALRQKGALRVAEDNLALLEDFRRRISVQVQVGEAARLELTRAEAEVASARINVRSAQLRVAGALSNLAAAIGGPIGAVELEADLVDTPSSLPPLEELQAQMIARHPTLALADAETRVAEMNIASERAQRIPQPSFWADWLHQPEAAQYRFGITIPVPLWNRREGPIAEAVAARRRASALADQRRLQLTAALEQAFNMYQVTSRQMEIFEEGTLRQAEAAVKAAQAAFKFGERGIIEVLDAQRVLRAAQLEYLNAQFDRQHAVIQLEQLRVLDLGDPRP